MKYTLIAASFLVASMIFAQQSAVEFGGTFAKGVPANTIILDSLESWCNAVKGDGTSDEIPRTCIFQLGIKLSAKGAPAKEYAKFETTLIKYAKESTDPVIKLFFIEQLRWFGGDASLPIVNDLTKSDNCMIATMARFAVQNITGKLNAPCMVYTPTPKIKPLDFKGTICQAEGWCKIAGEGTTAAIQARQNIYLLGQRLSLRDDGNPEECAQLEALCVKYAKEAKSSFLKGFFIDQLRFIGTEKGSLEYVKEMSTSKCPEVAHIANLARQQISGVFDNQVDKKKVTTIFDLKPDSEGFYTLFDGSNLDLWTGNKSAYSIDADKNLFVNPASGGRGDLYTTDEFANFVLRFEFKLTAGANNGIGIRSPHGGDAAYEGFELQVLDDTAPQYAKLAPYQYHGSVYGIVAPKRPATGSYQNVIGDWNQQEVVVNGSHIKITLNGNVIIDANVNDYIKDGKTPDGKDHPGLKAAYGFIRLCGHGDKLWYRNISVKPLVNANNTPPPGFTALFNGKDLTNFKGVTTKEGFDNPVVRRKATPEKRAEMQKFADELATKHWSVKDGVLFFDGKKGGYSLATAKDYGDFEMWVDWRLLHEKGDSGFYLRGNPQVQIWDAHNQWKIGSGGLYNNKHNPSKALLIADNKIGEWNTFNIRMIGDKVTVFLNGKRVVNNTILENYWERGKPLPATEQIELQCHGDPIEFRNIFIREL